MCVEVGTGRGPTSKKIGGRCQDYDQFGTAATKLKQCSPIRLQNRSPQPQNVLERVSGLITDTFIKLVDLAMQFIIVVLDLSEAKQGLLLKSHCGAHPPN